MKTEYIRTVIRPNGCDWSTYTVHLCLDGNRLVEVYNKGWHTSPALPMDIQDASEALWLLDNHPEAKRFYS